jgi:hypothetical protein
MGTRNPYRYSSMSSVKWHLFFYAGSLPVSKATAMTVTMKYGDDRHRKPHGSSWCRGVIVASLNGTLFRVLKYFYSSLTVDSLWSNGRRSTGAPLNTTRTLLRLTHGSTTVDRMLQACMHCLSCSDSREFLASVHEHNHPDFSPRGGRIY